MFYKSTLSRTEVVFMNHWQHWESKTQDEEDKSETHTHTEKTKEMSNTDSTKIRVSENNKYKFILSLYIKGY